MWTRPGWIGSKYFSARSASCSNAFCFFVFFAGGSDDDIAAFVLSYTTHKSQHLEAKSYGLWQLGRRLRACVRTHVRGRWGWVARGCMEEAANSIWANQVRDCNLQIRTCFFPVRICNLQSRTSIGVRNCNLQFRTPFFPRCETAICSLAHCPTMSHFPPPPACAAPLTPRPRPSTSYMCTHISSHASVAVSHRLSHTGPTTRPCISPSCSHI